MNGWIALAAFFATGLAGLALKNNLVFFSAPIVGTVVSLALRILNPHKKSQR